LKRNTRKARRIKKKGKWAISKKKKTVDSFSMDRRENKRSTW
jgi:hypothetical protein